MNKQAHNSSMEDGVKFYDDHYAYNEIAFLAVPVTQQQAIEN